MWLRSWFWGKKQEEQKAYVHIGPVKTGSTFIQKSIYENRDLLQKYGLDYPTAGSNDDRIANSEFVLKQGILNGKVPSDFSKNPKFLVSEEGLFFQPNTLRALAASGVKSRIIVFARRPAELIASWAAEYSKPYNAVTNHLPMIKGPVSIETGLDVLSNIYESAARDFIKFLNEHKNLDVVLQIYSRETTKKNQILRNFFNSLDLNAEQLLADRSFKDLGRVNEGSPRKYCDISVIAWQLLGNPTNLRTYNHKLVQELSKTFPGGDARPVIDTLDDATIEKITHRFRFFDDFLSQQFLSGRPVFVSPYPEIFGTARQPYEPLSQSELKTHLDIALSKVSGR